MLYHVLNRANVLRTLFDDDGDYAAFERVLMQASERLSMRLLAHGVMPNHGHLIVWPRHDGDLSRFMNWLTLTHTQRWHQHRHSAGEGHVYQGRFKSFPVETSEYLLTVGLYVERSGPVPRGTIGAMALEQRRDVRSRFMRGPMERPAEWLLWVNEGEPHEQLHAVRRSVTKGQPYGSEPWMEWMVMQWNLGETVRGRPKKELVNNGS